MFSEGWADNKAGMCALTDLQQQKVRLQKAQEATGAASARSEHDPSPWMHEVTGHTDTVTHTCDTVQLVNVGSKRLILTYHT